MGKPVRVLPGRKCHSVANTLAYYIHYKISKEKALRYIYLFKSRFHYCQWQHLPIEMNLIYDY